MQKILIFTDSRGEHKASFQDKLIFPEKIKKEYSSKYEIELMLCPCKWTTILDFLELVDKKQINTGSYKYIFLYAGIVDHSPRPIDSANKDLYNNSANNLLSYDNCKNKKIKLYNNKKYIFDKTFGEAEIKKYLSTSFDVNFEGKKTINMYSLEMFKSSVTPKLKSIKNLVFINSNRILNNWDGNYERGRPRNIKIVESYSEMIEKDLQNVINLLKWNENEIKKYTIDNMHLSYAGSEWLYDEIVKYL